MLDWMSLRQPPSRQVTGFAEPVDETQIVELAQHRIDYAAGFSLLSPFMGYSYTGRFKALGIVLASGLALLVGVSKLTRLDFDSRKVQVVLGLVTAGAGAVDNSQAIFFARKREDLKKENSVSRDS